ncbi:hypothetical protein AAFC00_007079 [Neodothiora populina]|uniref:Myb-like domain-containing protein n=1 Tax=Neodothiora populina TaxID=2781224 RepID=A0ABR3PC63_9PEZI
MSVPRLTPKEVDLLTAVATSGEVTVSDWAAVATSAGMTTGKYARDTWTVIKKKLKAASEAAKASDGDQPAGAMSATDTPAAKKAKKPATLRKRTHQPAQSDDEDDYVPRSLPTKKGVARAKGTPRTSKKAKVAAATNDDEIDFDQAEVNKSKKRGVDEEPVDDDAELYAELGISDEA